MTVSTYPTPIHFGFLSICEGAALGLVAGWWLQSHLYPPAVFIGCGIVVAGLYYFLLTAGRGSSLSAPIVIVSMMIWGFVGWHAGGYAFRMFSITPSGVTMLDTVTAWKVVAALVLAFVAYSDKASMAGQGHR